MTIASAQHPSLDEDGRWASISEKIITCLLENRLYYLLHVFAALLEEAETCNGSSLHDKPPAIRGKARLYTFYLYSRA